MSDFSFLAFQRFSVSAFQTTLPPLVALGARFDLGLEMTGGRTVREGEGLVVSGQWSVVSGQWSVVSVSAFQRFSFF